VKSISRATPPQADQISKGGPVIIRIPTLSGVSLGPGATSALVAYRWPRNYRLKGWMLLPRSGLLADCAALQVRMKDHRGQDLVNDGYNVVAGAQFISALSFMGIAPWSRASFRGVTWSPVWNPIARVVQAGHQWFFQLTNNGAGAITPEFAFLLATPDMRAA
jgi:hypothetical protein